jgi:iron(III) transport system substrate-binding protein
MKSIMKSAGAMAIVAALALAGCSAPEGATTSDGGAGDGTLRIACSQQENFCKGMTDAFTKATGIKAIYQNLGSGEVIARLQASSGSKNEFDVWAGGQVENHLIAADKGFIEPYVSPNASKLPEEYADPDGKWAGFYTDSLGFCSNTATLKSQGLETPDSWQSLVDAKYAKQIAMPNPAGVGTGYMAIWTVDLVNKDDKDATFDYLKKLDASVLQYTDKAATVTLMAGRGEVATAVGIDSDCTQAIQQGMKDLVLSYPKEGTGYEIGAVSLLKGADNAEQAKKFYDWLLTADAQNGYPDWGSFTAPTNPESKLGPDTPPQDTVKRVDWDPAKASAAKEDMVEQFQSIVMAK